MASVRFLTACLAGLLLASGALASPVARSGASAQPETKGPEQTGLARAEGLIAQGQFAAAEAELRALLAGGLGPMDGVRARLTLVNLLVALDRPAEAEPLAHEALAATPPDHPLRGWAIGSAVDVFNALDRPADALPLMEEDISLARGPDARARALSRLGATLVLAGRYREGTDRLGEALTVMGGQPADPALRLATLSQLGRALDLQGRHAEAEPYLQEALSLAVATFGERSLYAAGALNDLGTHASDVGRYGEADATLRRALHLYEQLSGPESGQTAAALTNLGNVHMNAGRWSAAEPYYRRAASINGGRDSQVDLAIDLTNLGWVVHKQGREAEAEEILSRSLRLFEATLGTEHPYTATARTNLAGALRVQGRCAEAAAMFREVARVYSATIGDDNPLWPFTLNGLAACLAETGGDPAEIEGLFTRALSVSWSVLSPGHPYGLEPANDYAAWLISVGRAEEARNLLDRAGDALLDRTVARAGAERTAQGELAQFRTLFQLRVDAAWALAQTAP